MRHLLTLAILLVAVALYAFGMKEGGVVVILLGAAFEIWFWMRLIRRRSGTDGETLSENR